MEELNNIEGVRIISENIDYNVAEKYFYYPIYIGLAIFFILCIIAIIKRKSMFLFIGGMFVFGSIGVSFGSSVSNMTIGKKVYQFSLNERYYKNHKQAMKEMYNYFDVVNENDDGTYEGIIICNESEK